MKNVHWKLSAKNDNLMVKEPSLPIYKNFKIMLILTDNAESNNIVMAKFAGVCMNVQKNEIPCAVSTTKAVGAYPLSSQTNIYSLYRAIYTQSNLGNADVQDAEPYSIFADPEEVAK